MSTAALTQIANMTENPLAIFNFHLDWDAVEKNNIVTGPLRGYVTKQINEALLSASGSPDAALISATVLTMLQQRSSPTSIIQFLSKHIPSLDAQAVVVRVWKRLLYEFLKVSPATAAAAAAPAPS